MLRFFGGKASRRANAKRSNAASKGRRLRFEGLESRELLSVSPTSVDGLDMNASSCDAPNVADADPDALSTSYIRVDTLEDSFDPNDGATSLREAVYYAQKNDKIVFKSDLEGTIILQDGEISIDKVITIDGQGLISIDAGKNSRIFNICTQNRDEPVEIAGLTLQNGKTSENGGAIYIDSSAASLTNLTVTQSRAYSGGGISVVDSDVTLTNALVSANSVSRNGGGIFVDASFRNTSSISIADSTIEGNSAFYGAGMFVNDSEITLTNSVVAVNVAKEHGGGLYIDANEVSITNVTIAGNSAVFGSGGGIYSVSPARLTLVNTIAACNLSTSGGINVHGKLSYERANNLLDYDPSFVVAPSFDEEGTILNADEVDLHLLSYSNAIDAGDNNAIDAPKDVEGEKRVYNDRVDIGAYEYQGNRSDVPFYSSVVDTLEDSFDLNDGKWSLREAIYYATEYETITFAPKLEGTISLQYGQLPIDKALAIDGDERVAIDGHGKSRIFNVSTGNRDEEVLINGFTLVNGVLEDRGGGISVYNASLTLTNATIRKCVAVDGGGAISVLSGSLTMRDSILEENVATYGEGGALWISSSEAEITNSTIAKNRGRNSGAIELASSAATITNATIAENTVILKGPAINATKSDLRAYNTIVALNGSSDAIRKSESTVQGSNNIANFSSWDGEGQNYLYDKTQPLFIDPENGDYGLTRESQALDKGDDARAYAAGLTASSTDLAGNPRFQGASIDVGAYERGFRFDAPTDLKVASRAGQKVTLTWKDVSDCETGYRLQYSSDGGKTWRLTTNLRSNATSTVTYSLQPDTTYLFRVCAVDGAETTAWTTVEYSSMEQLKAPTNLYIADYDATDQKVSIAWKDNAATETGYRIQCSTDGGKTWGQTTEVGPNATSCEICELNEKTSYKFRICAVRGTETSAWKTIGFATSQKLEAPTDVKVASYDKSTRKATITWTDNATTETGYRLQYSTDDGKTWRLTTDLDADATSCRTYSLKADASYKFRICAVRDGVRSAWKEIDLIPATPVPAPTDLRTVSYDPATRIATLAWTDNTEDETYFQLQHSTDGGQNWSLTTNFLPDTTSCSFYEVDPNKTYLFRIRAIRGEDVSAWTYSEEFVPLLAPSDLRVASYDPKTRIATLAWTDNTEDETAFQLQHSTDGGQNWRLTTNFLPDTTSCSFYEVNASKTYLFRIRTVRGTQYSSWIYSESFDPSASSNAIDDAFEDLALDDFFNDESAIA